jgi:hypothetical protein
MQRQAFDTDGSENEGIGLGVTHMAGRPPDALCRPLSSVIADVIEPISRVSK